MWRLDVPTSDVSERWVGALQIGASSGRVALRNRAPGFPFQRAAQFDQEARSYASVFGFAPEVMQFVSAKLCLSAASALNVAAIMVNAESTETQSSQRSQKFIQRHF